MPRKKKKKGFGGGGVKYDNIQKKSELWPKIPKKGPPMYQRTGSRGNNKCWEIGRIFSDFLGYNPLKNSIDVTNQGRLCFHRKKKSLEIAEEIGSKDYIEEVSYGQTPKV